MEYKISRNGPTSDMYWSVIQEIGKLIGLKAHTKHLHYIRQK